MLAALEGILTGGVRVPFLRDFNNFYSDSIDSEFASSDIPLTPIK
ncbi:hypothetical protein BH11PLA2_BH11PLA2_14430 [soil metagenome]